MHCFWIITMVVVAMLSACAVAYDCDRGTITTLDSGIEIWVTAIEIGSDALPVIAYYSATHGSLKSYHCDTADCALGSAQLLTPGGEHVAIAIGSDQLPIMTYFLYPMDNLYVYHCSSLNCTSGASMQFQYLATYVDVCLSVAVGADGFPIIPYSYGYGGTLRVFHCNDVVCGTGTVSVLDTVQGRDNSIAIGADSLPIISYYDPTNGFLKVYHCVTMDCSNGTARALDTTGTVGGFTSIAIGSDTFPVISYYDRTNGDLRVYKCSTLDCASGTARTLDSAGDVGYDTSIAIGRSGFPIISYRDGTNGDLKVFECASGDCSSGLALTLDSAGYVGWYTSIAIGSDNFPIISYRDVTNSALKVFHCGIGTYSSTCSPSASASASVTASVTVTPSLTGSMSGTMSVTPSMSNTVTRAATPCATFTPTGTTTVSGTVAPSSFASATVAVAVSMSGSHSHTAVPSASSTPSTSASFTITPSSTTATTCASPLPAGLCSEVLTAVCIASVWQVQCNQSAPPPEGSLVLNGTVVVVVLGALTLPPTVIVTVAATAAANGSGVVPLRVTDGGLTLRNGTTVVLVLSTRPSIGDPPLVLFEASDGIVGEANITVDDRAVSDLDKCERVMATQQRSGGSLSVLLSVQRDSGCDGARHVASAAVSWWVYVLAVGGAVLCVLCVVGSGATLLSARRSVFLRRLFRHIETSPNVRRFHSSVMLPRSSGANHDLSDVHSSPAGFAVPQRVENPWRHDETDH